MASRGALVVRLSAREKLASSNGADETFSKQPLWRLRVVDN
jgi:hypothetical protein